MVVELKNGWSQKPLELLSEFILGGDWGEDPKTAPDEFQLAYVIRGSEFRNWKEEKGGTAVLRALKPNSLDKRSLREGDILIEISGGGPDQPVGRTVVIESITLKNFKDFPVVATNFLRLFRPNLEIDSTYLNYYLTLFYFSGEVVKYQGGSNNLRNLKFKDYSKINIPFPPLPEQRAIVAKLEVLLGELDRSVVELDVALGKLGVYRQSVLKEGFSGRLTGAESGFKIVSLKSIATEIRNGLSTKPNGVEGDIKILRISAARPMLLNLDDHRFIKIEDANLEKSELKKGDLLFTRYNGSRNYVGVGGIFNSEGLYTYPDKLIRVRLNQKVALPRFVMYAVNSGDSRKFLEERIRTTAGQSGISGSDLKQTPIPLPSLPEQHQIVAEIESRLSVADALEREIVGALERVKGVRMGVLKRAFGGELLGKEELTGMKN